jgi:(1->4)-alpha-D-glucan 1-alpha-D-glucosylmutase
VVPHTPVSTYRLQLSHRFSFADANRLVPYLDRLGISDCYVSPLLKAVSGSTHGYDLCDPDALNPEIGSDAEFGELTGALRARRMGLLVDFVPNHMGLDASANRWWRSVLEHGRSSPYADYFDIDWEPITPELKNRLLLAILQNPYGEVLEQGELRLEYSDGGFNLLYGSASLPIEPRSSLRVLDRAATLAPRAPSDPVWQDFRSIQSLLLALPEASSDDAGHRVVRQELSQLARTRLGVLVDRSPTVHAAIDAAIAWMNGTPGTAETFDGLHDLLERQPYCLAHWKTAFDEINYRRFFDINNLGALRMEDPRVFAAAHTGISRLIAQGQVTGLRLDHPDGLLDPGAYFEQLQHLIATNRHADEPFYIVVEKILADGESAPAEWPVAGTTGYGFLNVVNRLFVDAQHAAAFTRLYSWMSGRRHGFAEVAYQSRRHVMGSSMASELAVLARALKLIAVSDRRTRDFTLTALRRTILEVVACFPVYRTYVTANGFSAVDRQTIDFAVDRARQRNPVLAPALFLFLRSILLATEDAAPADFAARRRWAMKFQQFCAPIQAKGIEDTGFYRYTRLLSLNEVGGNPARFGSAPEEFHEGNRVRAERWPLELVASATHDTKRGEDARARLNILSEIPQTWRRLIGEWRRNNAVHRTAVDREFAPDRNDEYLFYQTIVGAWPAEIVDQEVPYDAPSEFVARVQLYMQKAIKEAKIHTSWVNQNTAYEDAVTRFVESTLKGPGARTFLASFEPFVRRVAMAGVTNSLAQLVMKLTSPGVSDFYQGTELWQLDLADPDNRRPVDFEGRAGMLDALLPWIERVEKRVENACPSRDEAVEQFVAEMLEEWPDARIKMFVTACGLRLRRREPALFCGGTYQPLAVHGADASRVVAFSRSSGGRTLVAAVPRLVARWTADETGDTDGVRWSDTRVDLPSALESTSFVDALTGAQVTPAHSSDGWHLLVKDLFRVCPAAVLVGSRS